MNPIREKTPVRKVVQKIKLGFIFVSVRDIKKKKVIASTKNGRRDIKLNRTENFLIMESSSIDFN
jgi:hypothetical protein